MASPEIEALRATDRKRLERLQQLRLEVDRRIGVLRRRMEAYDVLMQGEPADDDALASAISDGEAAAPAPRGPQRSSDDGEILDGSEASPEKRFSRQLLPFAREVIVQSGPRSSEQLAGILPTELRDTIESLGSRYPVEYRIRRAFRRARDFSVDRKSGRITYVGWLKEGEVPIVDHLVLDDDGAVAEVTIREPDGTIVDVPIDRFNADVHNGRLFGVRGPGRISPVAYVDGFFRSFHRGELNEDMRNVPRERRQKGTES
jgi:hypothetical protein